MNAAQHASKVRRWADADAVADAAVPEPAERADLMTARNRYYAARHADRAAIRAYENELRACDYADTPSHARTFVRWPTPTAPQPKPDPSGLRALLNAQGERRMKVCHWLNETLRYLRCTDPWRAVQDRKVVMAHYLQPIRRAA